MGQYERSDELLGHGEDVDLVTLQRPGLGETGQVVHGDQPALVFSRQGQHGEGPGPLTEMASDRSHLEAGEQRAERRHHLGHHRIVARVEALAERRGYRHEWLDQGAPLRQRGARQGRTVDGDERRLARHAEERVNVAPDQRGEFLEALALDGQRIGIAVGAARDVERELRGGLEPRVGTLLTEDVEDVTEHPLEWVITHNDNVGGESALRIAPRADCHSGTLRP